jgi:thioredoxin reductase
MFDVIVAGGSYAGMAAALQLARARRKVLVVDAGQRRNRFAHESHGFLTRDGEAPGEIAAKAREQLLAYPTVTWLDGKAAAASGKADGFSVTLQDGKTHNARRLILATGIVDVLPDVPGLAERWGKTVFHCPYCHGYELNQGRLGVLATGAHSMHQAMMIPNWGTTTLFTNGAFTPNDRETAELTARGVRIETTRVMSAGGDGGIALRLEDGREVALDGLFVAPRMEHTSKLAHQLDCRMEDGPLGAWIATDALKATSVEGVFAAGDAARAAGSVTFAVADGAQAGFAAHRSLMFGLR